MISKGMRLLRGAQFFWKAHVGNAFWKDRAERRRVRKQAIEDWKEALLRPYLPFVESLKPSPPASPREGGKEMIYCLWLQGEQNAPEIVKRCIGSIRRRYPDRTVVLDESNLHEYVSLSTQIMKKWKEGKIVPANFSDIVRIELLYTRGGYWFDATDFLTGDIPEFITAGDFFLYMASPRLLSRMFVQTCFIRSKKGDPLMRMWRDLTMHYWENEDKAIDYFLVHYLLKFLVRHNKEAAQLFGKMPKLEHDATHRLFGIADEPFDRQKYEEMTRNAFFQKCNHRAANTIADGSMADYIFNGKV